jgi:hypothetical protein
MGLAGKKRVLMMHRNFEDPAAAAGSAEERRRVFRRVRHEIRDYLRGFPGKS